MPPKKATSAAPKKPSEHPPYLAMIKEAIAQLKERNGSSRQALKKYCKSNFKGLKDDSFDRLFNSALSKGVKAGELVQPKGPSGPVKLQKKEAAKATAKPAKAAGEKKKAATKKTTTTKKATTTKAAKPKAAEKADKPKKAVADKPKKAAADKPKAKASDKLTKVKSGKVTKKAAAPKKAAKAAPAKKATPKKKKESAPAAAEAS
jgi:histone H1/5